MQKAVDNEQQIDAAVAEGGAYDVLYKRLQGQGSRLYTFTQELNQERQQVFGDTSMKVQTRIRIRTENNCVARDIVRVGDCLLLGYNVFIGLKKETAINDVFALYRLVDIEDGYEVEDLSVSDAAFLNDPRFVMDFNELHAYYSNTRLMQLVVRQDKLLAAFQIGERLTDIRVFRWALPVDGNMNDAKYIDNRGDQDIQLPAAYDFEWLPCTRRMLVETGKRAYWNIEDTLFLEVKKGVLSIQIEDNTATGLTIHEEILQDENQSLNDIRLEFARLGSLLLLRFLPYREQAWRYLVFNDLNKSMVRIDAISQACIQLPEDHGIIFPGGYYLQNGEHKTFDLNMDKMLFERSIKSPNGQDVLYAFYEEEDGASVLLNYDVVSRQLQNPIFGHGYARYEDGRMVIFAAESNEPTRVHPMQVWQTPYYSDVFAANMPKVSGFFGRVGNRELVRGISDLLEISRLIQSNTVSIEHYTSLCQSVKRVFDAYHWLDEQVLSELSPLLKEVAATAELVLDEYEKVQGIQAQSKAALANAEHQQQALLQTLLPDSWQLISDYVEALNGLTAQRGLLLTIKDLRYIDVDAILQMEADLQAAHEKVVLATVEFLSQKSAFEPYYQSLNELDLAVEQAQTVSLLQIPLDQMNQMSSDLDMLTQLVSTLQVDDATQKTHMIEAITTVFAKLNQGKALAAQRRKNLLTSETLQQFGAQFQLFNQSVTSALSLANSPESCDEQLSKLLVQLEDFESAFGEHEAYLTDILNKREEVLESFESHKQSLLDDRQRKAQAIQDAALRIIETMPRRLERLQTIEEINAFFAADALVLKLKELVQRLRDLQDGMRADDIEARLKSTQDNVMRALRDKTELFEDDGRVIRLGKHRFSVNTQALDITLLPRNGQLNIHLSGTDYFEPTQKAEFDALKDFWQVVHESESGQLYRAEYLAVQFLKAARAEEGDLHWQDVKNHVHDLAVLTQQVRQYATPRYKEGYEKGVHDHDAALIIQAILPVAEYAGLLRYGASARALAYFFWHTQAAEQKSLLLDRAKSNHAILQVFAYPAGVTALQAQLHQDMEKFVVAHELAFAEQSILTAAEFLVAWLAQNDTPEWVVSKYAAQLAHGLQVRLEEQHVWSDFQSTLARLAAFPHLQWQQLSNALYGLSQVDEELSLLTHYIDEAVAMLILQNEQIFHVSEVALQVTVNQLLGSHVLIEERALTVSLDTLLERVRYQNEVFIPQLRRYHSLRADVLKDEANHLRLDEFRAKPLTSFVRNQLIQQVYLPVIGDNLAKQMGTVGESKRTDLMGLLMLISPPGYGKTTLMEYVAARLGLIFMKINGPSLGHRVYSLDPAQAPDSTSAQELEKLNLALEMGNNVMLYVDDIQHTSSEFLQKFISLCDGTRRIDGVWRGQTKTYDMRGRRFCVVMAGNPYTESGEVFQIPDMLANRADVYNLGETLGNMQEAFNLSYLENSLTSNPILAPLATRDMQDVYTFIDKAAGKDIANTDFTYHYSSAEIQEITQVFSHLLKVREVLAKVNAAYIASAAQSDDYRTEPAFKLQGSYRNMNKMVEKVSAIMNDVELNQLVSDHYQGEAQLLTTKAEENLLKLSDLRGVLTAEEKERWLQIKTEFVHQRKHGKGSEGTAKMMVDELQNLSDALKALTAKAIVFKK